MDDLGINHDSSPGTNAHSPKDLMFPKPTGGHACERCRKIPIELFLFGSRLSSKKCRARHDTKHCKGKHSIRCDGCARMISDEPHYHCAICKDNDYNLCDTCKIDGKTCLDESHKLRKTVFEEQMIRWTSDIEEQVVGSEEADSKIAAIVESMQPYLLRSSVEELEKSAVGGCHMCSVISSRIDAMIPRQLIKPAHAVYIECKPLKVSESLKFVNYMIRNLVEDPDGPDLDAEADCDMPQTLLAVREPDSESEVAMQMPISFKVEGPRGHFFSKQPWSRLPGTELHQISPIAGGRDVLRVVRRWISSCRNDESCSVWPKLPFIPTRLVDVEASQDGKLLRIVDGRSIGTLAPEYAVLSYCWGVSQQRPWITTHANISSRRSSFSYEILPKTIADAVEVTLAAGVRYLWVDSLCIMQGDEEDWRQEASKMKDVYTSAQFTIISGSEDATTGLFLPRESLKVSAAEIALSPVSEVIESHRVTVFPCLKEVEHYGPTTKRAWCLQEELLSPRRLYFTEGQFRWECACSRHEETGTWSPGVSEEAEDAGIQMPRYPKDVLTYPNMVVHEWCRIVEEYTSRRLTHHGDVFAALAGIAGAMRDKYEAVYCAGLWDFDPYTGLLWQRVDSDTLERLDDVPGVSGAPPSWSWLGVKGRVLFNRGDCNLMEPDAEVINYEAHTRDGDDEFGRVVSGWMRLEARLLRCAVTQHVGGEKAELAKRKNTRRPGENDGEDGEKAAEEERREEYEELPDTYEPAPPGGRMDLNACLSLQPSYGADQQEESKEGDMREKQQQPFASVFFDDEEVAQLSEVYCAFIAARLHSDVVRNRNGIALVRVPPGEGGDFDVPVFRRVGMVTFWDRLIGDGSGFLMDTKRTSFVII